MIALTREKRLEILIAARAIKAAVRMEAGADATRDAAVARLDAMITQAKAAPDEKER